MITILHGGFGTLVQDEGRIGFRHYGIPISGSADTYHARIANILVGNARNDALLEIPFGKSEIHIHRQTLIAFTGIGVEATSRECGGNREFPVQSMRPVLLSANSILRFKSSKGLRAYCAFAGGINVPIVMQSRSTYTRANLGGVHGRILWKGDRLMLFSQSPYSTLIVEKIRKFGTLFPRHIEARFHALYSSIADTLHCLLGREYSELDEVSKNGLFQETFRVLPASDRMGIRLQPTNADFQFHRIESRQVISRAVFPGTLQCTPDGNLILLLADAQTTGGYPVLGHVCIADVARAAQFPPNHIFSFRQISIESAQKLYIQQEQKLQTLSHAMRLFAKTSLM